MAGVLGLKDVSSKDTGAGSKLKTGNKRSYNMPRGEKGQKLSYASLDSCKASAKSAADRKKCESYFKKKSPEKPKPLSKKQDEAWTRYMQQGSFYYDQADSSEKAILDSLMRAKLKKIE